jgi:phosphopantothenoylcysteine decarboxylase/phosphopantothenate--cysteine ligase
VDLKGKKILIGISGGIAAYKICSLVRLFIKAGAEVKVVMTPAAVSFVSPVTLSALSRNEVVINMLPDQSEIIKSERVDTKTWHVNYGLWADIFIIAPATCNTIGKAFGGISDNFLLSTLLACRCPVLFAPAMDDDMYKNKVTQRNIEALKAIGYHIADPVFGELASGLTGEGRMSEPETIFEKTKVILAGTKDLSGKKILITAGPTREYIDKVRFISNPSTGKMGFELARAAQERGAEVTLITGPVNLETPFGVNRIDVISADDMFRSVKSKRKGKQLIIMSAAIEDFTPLNKANVKIKKEDQTKFVFEFTKVVDILSFLGKSKDGYKLIGFAVETDNEINNAKKKLTAKNLDIIVLNNPNTVGAGFGSDTNVVTLIDRKSSESLPIMSKFEVANRILDRYLKLR